MAFSVSVLILNMAILTFARPVLKKAKTPPCGTIYDRAKGGFVAPNGKKPLHYTIFMKKVGKTEQQVRNELAKFDITVDDNLTLLRSDADA